MTYGDNKFANARNRLVKQAKDFGEFDVIKGFSQNDLTPSFVKKYKEILSLKRGGGYWIWKLDIINTMLNLVEENDFIVYLDAGCHLNNKGKKRFYEYIDMFNGSNYGMLSFQIHDQIEKKWTTTQILNYFNVLNNKNIIDSGIYVGGVIILRKNKHLYEFLNEFEKCIEFDKYLITDKYNKINQNPYFKENRHDKSITSIIRKKNGSLIVETDESFVRPFGGKLSLKYPFWAMRSNI